MNSKERIVAAVEHREPDRLPLDFGSTSVSGMAASVVYKLRQALGLDEPGVPVKVIEPLQVLGQIAPDLREALALDAAGVRGRRTTFGFENTGWKPWRLFDGTPVLVPAAFPTEPEPDGSLLMYPQGDRSAPPSARMPAGGYYFDCIERPAPIVEEELDPNDNVAEFRPLTDEDLAHLDEDLSPLAGPHGPAVVGGFAGAGFGDIARLPGPALKHPKGIRSIEEWYVSMLTRPDFIREVFALHCDIALANLERARQVVGDRVHVLFISGTDFGTQRGPFFATDVYRNLFKPFHARVNDWVHANTSWKTFIHTCGGIEPLIEDFIDAGFDILNPVQCSADGMAPEHLKRTYGDRITFWGGGIDTQKTLPFGTPDQVRDEVKRRVDIFAPGGGFVFGAIHNVQANTPIENLLAMFEAFEQCR